MWLLLLLLGCERERETRGRFLFFFFPWLSSRGCHHCFCPTLATSSARIFLFLYCHDLYFCWIAIMGKQRMTALDVRATVEEMRGSLVGLRVLNVYNISSKMFLFKFGSSDRKVLALLENGVRFHITELVREKPKVPSQFVLKLRKHIRAWRLSSITQLQHDRTIDLCFGTAGSEGCFHIIIELFAKGNLILTDHRYSIMVLLRTHRDDDVKLMVRELYPITDLVLQASSTGGSTNAGRGEDDGDAVAASGAAVMLVETVVDAAGALKLRHFSDAELSPAQQAEKQRRLAQLQEEWAAVFKRNGEESMIQSILSGLHHFGPNVAQHILTVSQVANQRKRELGEGAMTALFQQMQNAMLEAWDLARMDLTHTGGYLVTKTAAKKRKAAPEAQRKQDDGPAASSTAVATGAAVESTSRAHADPSVADAVVVPVAVPYDDFTPILLAQYQLPDVTVLHRPSFGRVCDEFFLITETDRIETQNEKRGNVVLSKQEKFKRDHERRIQGLEKEREVNQLKGEQLVMQADRVDEAIDLINGALATGIQWEALRKLLKRRNAEGHPVAFLIHELHLDRNSISVLLEAEVDEEAGVEDSEVPPLVVEVNLSKTAHANAADYFQRQKATTSKLGRTLAATEKAAAGAARRGEQKAAKQKKASRIFKERQKNWWEKYYWFRTSAGDVVLRGKDLQTTELLMRRLLRLGDLFIHCDVDGALPCILRPMTDIWTTAPPSPCAGPSPVAAISLEEAGAWCVAHSGAWEAKQSVGAWWIYASQVTGGAASGSYHYTGERHHLLPRPLALGCGLLFCVQRSGEVEEDDKTAAAAAAAARRERLVQELPNVLGEREWKAGDADVIAPDPASSLAGLLSIEELRAEQQQQRRTYAPPVPADSTEPAQAKKASRKGQKGQRPARVYARNSRVDKAGLRAGAGCRDEEGEDLAAGRNTQEADRQLTKHERRKLKKIQARYGDQDEEDRLVGARLNGNDLAKVQLQELEVAAQKKETARRSEREAAKEGRRVQRRQGKLRYVPVAEAEEADQKPGGGGAAKAMDDENDSADEDDDEAMEEVSDFTDDDEDGGANVNADDDDGEDEEEEDGDSNAPRAEINTESANIPKPPFSESNGNSADVRSITASAAAQNEELRAALPRYTMRPLPSDVVQHILPVCSPFSVLVQYAYRVECCMGNSKKGHLASSLQKHFETQAANTGPETPPAALGILETMKTINVNDYVDQLRGNMKPVNIRLGG